MKYIKCSISYSVRAGSSKGVQEQEVTDFLYLKPNADALSSLEAQERLTKALLECTNRFGGSYGDNPKVIFENARFTVHEAIEVKKHPSDVQQQFKADEETGRKKLVRRANPLEHTNNYPLNGVAGQRLCDAVEQFEIEHRMQHAVTDSQIKSERQRLASEIKADRNYLNRYASYDDVRNARRKLERAIAARDVLLAPAAGTMKEALKSEKYLKLSAKLRKLEKEYEKISERREKRQLSIGMKTEARDILREKLEINRVMRGGSDDVLTMKT